MISIIVPVYNKEKYLKKCLSSIKEQVYSEFECIIIDDGSTDSSSNIAKEFQENDSRYRYIYQENQGVSMARNQGISLARGEFICFVDADDSIKPDFLSKLISHTSSDIALIIQNSQFTFKEEKISISQMLSKFNKMYEYQVFNPPWGKLFVKKNIKHLFDNQLTIGEDLVFNLSYLCDNREKYILLLQDNGYDYINDIPNSISNSIDYNKLNNLLILMNYLIGLSKAGVQVEKMILIQSKSLFKKIVDMNIVESNKLLDWIYTDYILERQMISKSSVRCKILYMLAKMHINSLVKGYLNIFTVLYKK